MSRQGFLALGRRKIGRNKNGRTGRVDSKKVLNHMVTTGFSPRRTLGHRQSRVGKHHGPRTTIRRTGGIQMPGQETH